MITATVVLCTYNRHRSLANALNSIAASTVPESYEWEVLVVDNNSHDQTRDVIEDFCRRYPGRFRYLFEAQQGKSYALNAGIREARGDILAFTDDDVVVEPGWLANLTRPLCDREWAGCAGRTLPEQGFSPPRWLSLENRHALAPLGVFDLGLEAREITVSPFGDNMAFRKAMFDEYGGFRTDLGPRAGSGEPQKSEDSEFASRLLAAGERFRYEPSAIVYHSVPENRVQRRYFLAWWFDKARSDTRISGFRSKTKYCCWGVPLYLYRNLAVWTLRWLLTFESSKRFSHKLAVFTKAGEISEYYRHSLETKRRREKSNV